MKRLLLLCLGVVVTAAPVQADQTISYPKDHPVFSISFPDGWKVEAGESISASSPDDLVNMELIALEAEALDGAIDMAKESLNEELKDIKFLGEPEEGELNGMKVTFLNGQVTVEGVKMAVNCALFVPKQAKTFFMLFNLVPLDALKQHGDDVSKVLNSIQAK